jgi:hypothetical protein
LNPWDLIGLTGIIVVVGTLLVFWRSLMDQPAQQRTAAWDDRWPIGERPAVAAAAHSAHPPRGAVNPPRMEAGAQRRAPAAASFGRNRNVCAARSLRQT